MATASEYTGLGNRLMGAQTTGNILEVCLFVLYKASIQKNKIQRVVGGSRSEVHVYVKVLWSQHCFISSKCISSGIKPHASKTIVFMRNEIFQTDSAEDLVFPLNSDFRRDHPTTLMSIC